MIKAFIQSTLLNAKNNPMTWRTCKEGKWVLIHFPEIHKEIVEATKHLKNITFIQRIYHILNDIEKVPTCPGCNIVLSLKTFKEGYRTFCSVKCSANSEETRNKYKQTCLDKYGVDNIFKCEEAKNKYKQTCLEKYGVDHNFKAEEVREKREKTWMKNLGVDRPAKSVIVQEKTKQTCLDKYGVTCTLQATEAKEKTKQTWMKNFGDINPSKSKNWKDKFKNTQLERRISITWPKILKGMEKQNFSLLTTPEEYCGHLNFICQNGHMNTMNISNWYRLHNCPKCTLGGSSKAERDIYEFVSQYSQAISGNRKIIPPYQLDVFIPEHNLAIEHNGVFWHSEYTGTPKNYHLNKTNLCKDKGIDLIHIFEDEWLYKQDIVKSMLLNKLGKIETKIYAGDCTIKEIETGDKDNFLESNHIQGTCTSSVNLGLFYEEELVSILVLNGCIMKRVCDKLFISVLNGADVLYKYYLDIYNPEEVVLHIDRRFGDIGPHIKLGFRAGKFSKPNCWYVVNGRREQNSLLGNKIWDCGNITYKWRP